MPDTEAGIGYGITIELADPATPAAREYIGEVKSVNLPNEQTDQLDASHTQSPNKTREFVSGLTDAGEFSFEMNYVPGGTADARITAAKGKKKIVYVTFPNGCVMTFTGLRQGYERSAPFDDVKVATVTFKVSGEPTLTDPTAPRNLILPAIGGVAQVGAPLTLDWGVWAGAETISVQWQMDTAGDGVFTDIVGETGMSYVPVTGDVGNDIRAEVTGDNADFSTVANSAETSAVAAAA